MQMSSAYNFSRFWSSALSHSIFLAWQKSLKGYDLKPAIDSLTEVGQEMIEKWESNRKQVDE
jgi:hypothetical protein